jgi:phosphatidylserine/phosphatidylglycerophosphate/cardiolipin synthase-like enzyme
VKLLIQPGDGVQALVKGIAGAKSSVEIAIFRFDRTEVERALAAAVGRGVSVHALIASTNRTGEENLRKLELRLLGAGVSVARTASDLVRYHNKMMIIIDRRELYLLAFNLTYADMERSRSFGLITTSRPVVREAVKLFEADTKRTPYGPGLESFVVSPLNARKQLGKFIQAAKKDLIVYDPRVSDRAMMKVLEERAKAGVNVRIIGRVDRAIPGATVRSLPGRLHTRTMVRDGDAAFVGSQSLREMELDARREVGLIFRDKKIVARLLHTFEQDWELSVKTVQKVADEDPTSKIAKKVAKVVTRELPEVAPLVNGAVKEVVGDLKGVGLVPEDVEEIVKGAVRDAVREVVKDAVEEAVEKSAERR